MSGNKKVWLAFSASVGIGGNPGADITWAQRKGCWPEQALGACPRISLTILPPPAITCLETLFQNEPLAVLAGELHSCPATFKQIP